MVHVHENRDSRAGIGLRIEDDDCKTSSYSYRVQMVEVMIMNQDTIDINLLIFKNLQLLIHSLFRHS